jgi:rod shape determining protein RodA
MSRVIEQDQASISRRILDAFRLDPVLILLLFILSGFGLIVLYSAGGGDNSQMIRQLTRLGLAFALMVVVANISLRLLKKMSLWFYLAGVGLLVAVIIFGEVGKGAQRWLDLEIIRFQPSELMKLAMPMMLASFLSQKVLPLGWRDLIVSVGLVMVPVLLIARQPDLGTALLVGSAGFFVLFLAGVRWKVLMILGLLLSLMAPLLWKFALHDYQRGRILTMLDPESDPLGSGYHIIQSKIAIGSGGVYGKGWLNGTQSQLDFLPERSTDFIFSVYGEEFGLFGSLMLILLYLFIIYRGLYISACSGDTYGRLLAGALSLTFFVYLFVNTGMVTGLLPVVGVPLPLVSYGGTSMVTLMVGFGMIMAIRSAKRFLA